MLVFVAFWVAVGLLLLFFVVAVAVAAVVDGAVADWAVVGLAVELRLSDASHTLCAAARVA